MAGQSDVSVVAIGFSTLVDWLVGRGFLGKAWHAKQKALQSKVADQSSNLPHDLRPGEDTVLDFSFVTAVRDKLAETAERNFLNNLTGDAGRWDKIVKAYTKDNIHLGEAALALLRNGEFEIPHMRSRISKQQQQLTDLEKRLTEYQRGIQASQADYAKECRSIGIEGSDVMKELQLLTCNLPDVMYSALQTLKAEKMQQAVQHYIGNTAHVQQQCKGSSSSDAVMRLLPGLQEADVEPLSREQWQVKSASNQCDSLEEASPPPSEGLGLPDSATMVIDWDADFALDKDEGDPDAAEEDAVALSGVERLIDAHIADDSLPDSAIGHPVVQLIEDRDYRSDLLAEIAEVQAFLCQRTTELATSSVLGMTSATGLLFAETSQSEIQAMAGSVQASWDAFSSDALTRLLALHNSPKYFSRMVQSLQTQASQEAKYFRLLREAESKHHDISQALGQDALNVAALIAKAKTQKSFLEQNLELILHGQRVEITGLGKAISG